MCIIGARKVIIMVVKDSKEECRLNEYKFFDGKYWDVIYFSISRESFYTINGKIINRFL
jgi:hypothetical protein